MRPPVCARACVRKHVRDRVSEGVLTAVRIHAPLQLLQPDPEEHPPSLLACSLLPRLVPLRRLPAARGSAFIQPLTAPPLIQLFVSFFRIAAGDHRANAAFPVWQPGSGETSGERLSTAAKLAASPASSRFFFRVPTRALCHPLPLFWYRFEMK